jgi:pantoate--beta-alanine ligase
MVHDLNLNVEIVPVPTFRESDGLAMSSRNEYLDPGQRKAALVLYRALIAAREAIQKGEKNVESVRQVAMTPINVEPLASVDYIAVVDPETLQPMKKIAGQTLVVLAVRIGSTRLIDNMLIGGNE